MACILRNQLNNYLVLIVRLGLVQNVKVLVLFVAARSSYPMTMQEIYELCYQDECLSYFDICTAVPEMVTSGHLKQVDEERYEITEKGKEAGALTEDSIAFTVKQRAENAVARYNRQLRRSSFVKTQIVARDNGEYSVIMSLDDEKGKLMTLELYAPDQRQGAHLSRLFEEKAESLYSLIMMDLLDEENYQGNAVVNYTEYEIPYTRIIEHKHFEFGCQNGNYNPKTVITREYPATWKKGDEPYYPMNDDKNNALFAKYTELAEKQDKVIFGGRLGMYKYFDMDNTIEAALDLAKSELLNI